MTFGQYTIALVFSFFVFTKFIFGFLGCLESSFQNF